MNVARTRAGSTGRVDLYCTNTTTKCSGRRLMSVSVAEVVTIVLLLVVACQSFIVECIGCLRISYLACSKCLPAGNKKVNLRADR
jgi:hypothetical protein